MTWLKNVNDTCINQLKLGELGKVEWVDVESIQGC